MAKKKATEAERVTVLVNLTDKDGVSIIPPGDYPLSRLNYRSDEDIAILIDKGHIVIKESEEKVNG